MDFDAYGPLVVLSPHMDDAVLSAWSVLTRSQSVDVLNIFSGIPESGFVTRYDRIAGADDSAALVRARIAEDTDALALAGRTARHLGFLDHQYRSEPLDRIAIVQTIKAAIGECAGVFAPAGLGGHEDHVAVRDIGLELAAGSIPVALYAELPYAVRYGWPTWVTNDTPTPHLDPNADWDFYLEKVPCSRDALKAHVTKLTDVVADQKLAAMRAYKTQFPSLNGGIVNRLVNPAIRRHEVAWTIPVANA